MSDPVLGPSLVVLGYLSGSVPFGFLAGRFVLGVDVRSVGSGNIGATNVARAGGKWMGVAVLVLDAAKAIAPILLARALLVGPGAGVWVVAVAIAAFCGHLFPVWLGFRGGKGVATALGVFAVLSPWAALAVIATWGISWAATRISSVGSLSGTAVTAIVAFALAGPRSPVSWAGVVLASLIALRHRENIRRLLTGEERRKMRV